jgi:hypothetical protein
MIGSADGLSSTGAPQLSSGHLSSAQPPADLQLQRRLDLSIEKKQTFFAFNRSERDCSHDMRRPRWHAHQHEHRWMGNIPGES